MTTLAVIIFLAVLGMLVVEFGHRTLVVGVGAVLVLALGLIDQHAAFEAIDLDVIVLLASMMILVREVEQTGAIEELSLRFLKAAKGRSWLIVLGMTLMTAIMSAFLDNLTAVLLVAPLVIAMASRLQMDAVPLLIMMVFASNVGGTATLVGDPPNIIIAGHTGLSFGAFASNLAPATVLVFVLIGVPTYFLARRAFVAQNPDATIDDLEPEIDLAEGRELWGPVTVLLITLTAFFFHSLLDLEVATIALTGAVAALIINRDDIDEAIRSIDWPTLAFFASLFILVGTLEERGVLVEVANFLTDVTGGERANEFVGIIWLAAIGSALVDNIPFTAAMIPVVDNLPNVEDAHWWSLSLGACLGGNFTVVAAAANVSVQGLAERRGIPMGFKRFLKWGAPFTIGSLIVSTGYVMLRYVYM